MVRTSRINIHNMEKVFTTKTKTYFAKFGEKTYYYYRTNQKSRYGRLNLIKRSDYIKALKLSIPIVL